MSRYLKLLLLSVLLLHAQEPTSVGNNSSSDESLRLMYEVFTFSSDLENAYKIAKKGVASYPESLFWHQKLATVSEWLDKKPEAIKQMQYIYSRTKDKKMGEKILTYALSSYQYEVAAPLLRERALTDPTAENIKNLLFIYEQVGTPEVAAEILEELSARDGADPSWLLKAMDIYMELGESEQVERLAKKIEKREVLDLPTTEKLASYYLSQKDIQKSYDILLRADINKQDHNNTKYYQQVSDMGWYLQDPKHAAEASKELFLEGQARLIDIERIIYYYGDLDPDLTQRATLYGSRKFNNRYLYSAYLNRLFEEKKYGELSKEFERIEREKSGGELEKDSYFWLMKAHTLGVLGEPERAAAAFEEALRLEDGSPEILSTIMWFFIDHEEHRRLQKIIFELEESSDIAQVLWLPLAVGNFSLQRPDRAMAYIKKLMATKDTNMDIKLMYAYVMQAREERGAFMKSMREVYEYLTIKLSKNKNLLKNKDFLQKYISSAMYFMPINEFESLLKRSKSTLGMDSYIDISIAWSLRHNAQAQAKYLSTKLSTVEPWMQLNIALNEDDRTKQLDLLYRYHDILPIRDRVTTALNVGSVSLAQSLAFDGLEANRYDYLLYQQSRDLAERYADKLSLSLGYEGRGNIDRSYLNLTNRYYIARAWSFLANLSMARDKNIDPLNILNIPREDNSLEIGARREFDRGNLEFLFGLRSAVEEYFTLNTNLHYNLLSRVGLDLSYHKSFKAEESTYLLLGGKKDGAKAKVSFQFLPSSNISLALAYDKFYSQDDHYLGDGYYARMEWYRQVHSGYPDIAVGAFADYGSYNDQFEQIFGEKFDDEIDDKYAVLGTLGRLMPYGGRVLPEDFYNVGIYLFYGAINKSHYTRVWRPYAEISPYYNGYAKRFNLSVGGGYGGSLYGRDHLSIGFNYDQSVNGTQENNAKIYMNYMVFY